MSRSADPARTAAATALPTRVAPPAGVELPPRRVLLLLTIAVLAVGCIGYLRMLPSIADGQYMPAWSDEFAYYQNAKAYAENGRMEAAIILEESVSRIGEFDAHGFAYTLLHGVVAKVFGNHPLNIILANVFFLLAAVVLVVLWRMPTPDRLTIITCLTLYFMVPIWLFTYMQETMQLAFATGAGLLLLSIYRTESPARRRTHVILLLGLLLVASMFRPSWLMCTIALVPLARTRRQLVLCSLGFIIALVASFGYVYLFLAPYPYGFLSKGLAALRTGEVLRFFGLLAGNLATNLHDFFLTSSVYRPFGAAHSAFTRSGIHVVSFASKYILLGLLALLCWRGFRHRDRFRLGVALFVLLNLASLLLFYEAKDWPPYRVLAPMFYISVIALASSVPVRTVLPVLLLVMLPKVLNYSANCVIEPHRAVAARYRDNPAVLREFESVRYRITDRRMSTVLVSRRLYVEGDIPVLALPSTNAAGYPIRYTFNIHGVDLSLKKRGFVDYLLLPAEAYADGITDDAFSLRLERLR